MVDSCSGDAVTTIKNIQCDYSTAITPRTRRMYEGSKDNLIVPGGTCDIEGTFYKSGKFKLEVGSEYYPGGEGAGWGVNDTYEMQL